MGFSSLREIELLVVMLMALSSFPVQSQQYEFIPTKDGFDVKISSITIIRHTASQPFIFLGKGRLSVTEYRGNFKMTDYLTERVLLSNYTRIPGNNSDTLEMFDEGNAIQVSVTLQSTVTTPLTLDISVQQALGGSDRMWVRILSDATEHVYGGGEQYTYFDLKGRVFPIWVREQGVGRNQSELVTYFADLQMSGGDYHTTYYPQPTFVSSKKYYCHVDTTAYSIMDFSHADFHEIQIYAQSASLHFNYGNDFPDLIQKLSDLFGRQPQLPEWLNTGVVISTQGGTGVMLRNVTQCQRSGMRVSGVWIQDWAGSLKTSFGSRLFWNWRWNQTVYPGLKDAITKLKQQGIRVLVYINPNLNIQGDIFKEGDSKGYMLKDHTGQTLKSDFGEFFCGTVDLTNPEAFDWYKDLIKMNILDLGISGWMADFGEYIPKDALFYNKKSGLEMHNEYPALWARVNREAIEEANQLGEAFFFMRAGYTGSQNYTVSMWAGDQDVDFSYGDGVGTTITAALSMGMSGMGLTHFDIGGYTTFGAKGLRRSPEVLLRSAEMAVFTPVMRTHEGNQPSFNAQFYSSPVLLQNFARLSKVFTMLANYTRSVVRETSTTGLPAQRALFIHYPNDLPCYEIKYQYLFGRDLLVAPVYLQNVRNWTVFLPTDQWVHFWSGREFQGPLTVSIPAPIGRPAVFYRKASPWKTTFKLIPRATDPSNGSASLKNCFTPLILSVYFFANLFTHLV